MSGAKTAVTRFILIFLMTASQEFRFNILIGSTRGRYFGVLAYTTQSSIRISSSDASKYIESAYEARKLQKDTNPLLILTSDASRGAKRYTGIASILRIILPTIPDSSPSSPSSTFTSSYKDKDLVFMGTRRIQSQHAQDIVSSELAAILFGLKVMASSTQCRIPRRILILSDCESALSLLESTIQGYCLHKNRIPIVSKFRPILDKLKSSDGSIHVAKVRSAHSSEQGFFDHEAVDILASQAKGMSNSYWKNNMSHSFGQEQGMTLGNRLDDPWDHEPTSMYGCCINEPTRDDRVNNIPMLIRTMAPSLQHGDLLYLANSESVDTSGCRLNPKTPVQRKKESGARKQRCLLRMEEDLQLAGLLQSIG